MDRTPTISAEQIKTLNRPGPRYTSYPTAPVWTEAVGPEEFVSTVQNADSNQDISLYLHLPFCPRHCHFCGCNVIITSNREVISEYVRILGQEIERISRLFSSRKVRQLQWGGGSPTHLSPEEIVWLSDKIRSSFSFAKDFESGIEINPQYTTEELLNAISKAGFNRISMGIQDFDPKVQKVINRIQPYEQVQSVMQMVRERFSGRSVNFDLIYGLPYQTRESFQRTLSQVLELSPDRMALYSYAHVPWLKPLMKLFPEGSLADQVEKMGIFTDSVNTMLSHGYQFIGLDHFARREDPLSKAFDDRSLHRNFMGYTTMKGLDLIGMGMTSISQVDSSFFQNHKKLSTWRDAVQASKLPIHKGHICSPEDKYRQKVIDQILCQLSYQEDGFSHKFALEYEELVPLRDQGLIELDETGLRVTDLGRFFMRNICLPFDTYYREQKKSEKPMFSQTV
ncbi:MAG: oxygen-independent coproporphyrinogen III oxidase [Candidatus Cloacimonetes bacterium]|nr:oxygen-independent coproporphyrinogen III oxidase [Candidatus Cloacimonadota bacterium]